MVGVVGVQRLRRQERVLGVLERPDGVRLLLHHQEVVRLVEVCLAQPQIVHVLIGLLADGLLVVVEGGGQESQARVLGDLLLRVLGTDAAPGPAGIGRILGANKAGAGHAVVGLALLVGRIRAHHLHVRGEEPDADREHAQGERDQP